MRTVTLALTHYNRFDMLLECFAQVIEDPRISEIVISDDCSTDGSFEKLQQHFNGHPKVRLFQTKRNLDCYFNKREAVLHSTNEWVILFDCDNIMSRAYLDAIYQIDPWMCDTFYCPEFAEPHFDYTAFSGMTFDRLNVAKFMGQPRFACALNTANYFFHRDDYLVIWDGMVNPHTADTIFQAYNWLRSGRKLAVVPGLRYYHRIHNGSHYKQNVHKTGDFARQVEIKLRELR